MLISLHLTMQLQGTGRRIKYTLKDGYPHSKSLHSRPKNEVQVTMGGVGLLHYLDQKRKLKTTF